MKEIWKDVVGYEGKYQVSNLGNVMSLNYGRTKSQRLLKQTITYDGYHRVNLSKNKVKKCITVHILVARAFIPNPSNKPQVNHIDGNKDNNIADNLEWVTGKENVQHAIGNGLRPIIACEPKKGFENSSSKPILQYDLSGNFIKKWNCISDAARFYDCKASTIVNCSKGRIKTCKGFIWRPYTVEIPSKIIPSYNKNHKRIIIQRSFDGKIIRKWNGYKEISANTTYRISDICWVCKGKQKSAFGYLWECIDC